MKNFAEYLEQAIRLADEADEITHHYYLSQDLDIREKPDKSPVTKADLAVEKRLSDIVRDEYGHGYLGEEGTLSHADDSLVWVVDPIDGTKNFLRGMPVWGTLIALSDKDGPVVSVVSAPVLGRRWWAVRGEGAWTRDVDGTERKLRVSKVADLEHASILYASLGYWDKTEVGSDRVLALMKQTWRQRAVGDFMNYMILAEGAAEIVVEPDVRLWDVEAVQLIITEAGGQIWSAATDETKPQDPRIVVATNGLLEDAVKDSLGL